MNSFPCRVMPEEGWGVPEGFTYVWIHSSIVVVSKITFHPQICFFWQAGTILRTRPKRIILVRHGQSEGNIDESAYTRIPDSKIALTEVGWKQAVQCGKKIRHVIESDHEENWQVYFYVSPYRRTLQTLRGIGMAFERHRIAGVREEPRLREQDFGGYLPWPQGPQAER